MMLLKGHNFLQEVELRKGFSTNVFYVDSITLTPGKQSLEMLHIKTKYNYPKFVLHLKHFYASILLDHHLVD